MVSIRNTIEKIKDAYSAAADLDENEPAANAI